MVLVVDAVVSVAVVPVMYAIPPFVAVAVSMVVAEILN